MKSLLLLGAGASVPAGLKSSDALTDAAINKLDIELRPIAQYVSARIRLQRAERLIDYTMPIHIETLINSLSAWGQYDRLSDEYAMVKDWHGLPSLYEENVNIDDLWLGDVIHLDEMEIANAIDKRIEEALAKRTSTYYSTKIIYWLQQAVMELLYVGPDVKADYLIDAVKMCSNGNLTLATLNYDCLVETIAKQQGVLENISYGIQPDKSKSGRLIKAHGSTSWITYAEEIEERPFEVRHMPASYNDYQSMTDPVIVMGGQNKLNHKYPHFDLYLELRDKINEADRLIVSGYSFQDKHINYLLGVWLQNNPTGENIFHIIDPIDLTNRVDLELFGELGELRFGTIEELRDGRINQITESVDTALPKLLNQMYEAI